MPQYIVTYDIGNNAVRGQFEQILIGLNIVPTNRNQTTCFGFNALSMENLVGRLIVLINTNQVNLAMRDIITIYYPRFGIQTSYRVSIYSYNFKNPGEPTCVPWPA